jgi:hypothetical protein
LGNPVWIDLNLSVDGVYKDTHPMIPKGISRGVYLLDHDNKFESLYHFFKIVQYKLHIETEIMFFFLTQIIQ